MKERIIDKIKYIPQYGNILRKKTKFFNDCKFIEKENLYKYRLSKISIFKGENNSILGIQSFYSNMQNEEIAGEKIFINSILLDTINFEIPPNDFLCNINLCVGDDYITKIKFGTQKGKEIEVGEGGEFKKISCLNKTKDNIILILYGGYTNQFQSIGCKYINKNDYFGNVYGYFELRKKLKNENFKNEINSNINNYSENDKTLLSACLLPDACFNEIISFCVR